MKKATEMDSQETRIDSFVEEIIRREKSVEPDPFMKTRLIQKLENSRAFATSHAHASAIHILQPVILTLGLLMAALAGVTVGWNKAHRDPGSDYSQQVQELKSSLFISDFSDENTFFTNQQ